jgi:hypothetical protein
MDFDKELEKATQEMHDAEDELISSGFPVEQWTLIRKYITSVILCTHIRNCKAWHELPDSDSTS